MHHMHADVSTGSPGIGVLNDCDLTCGFWEPNLDTLKELLTAKLSLYLLIFISEVYLKCTLVRLLYLSLHTNQKTFTLVFTIFVLSVKDSSQINFQI